MSHHLCSADPQREHSVSDVKEGKMAFGGRFFWKPLRSWAPSVVYWAAGIQWDGDTEPTLTSAISKCHDTDDRR